MTVKVGQPAPDFTADAVVNKEFQQIKLSQFEGEKNVLLFFYPLDFTFVCPTEIIAFNERLAEFESRDTQVIGVSVDSKFTHLAWMNTPVNEGGIGDLGYPLVADMTKNIAREYGVLIEEAGVALRGTFLVDKKGTIRQITINDLPLGRNVDEFIRLIDAMNFTDTHGEVCPANWTEGKKTIKPNPTDSKEYFETVTA